MKAENEDKVINLLTDLAGKLGQSVETLWPHAVRYEAMSALGWMGASVAVVILCLVYRAKLGKVLKRLDEADSYSASMDAMPYQAANATVCVTAIAFVLVFFAQLPILLEPTGYLVRSVLGVR
jgi:uncharacterized membrane protein